MIMTDLTNMTLAIWMDSAEAHKLGYKAATLKWKKEGAKGKKQGFRANFYNALINGEDLVEKEDAVLFALNNGGSDNDIKQISHFMEIAKLVKKVREA